MFELFCVFAVGLRDYAWTSRYSVLYIDNPVRICCTFNSRFLSSRDFIFIFNVHVYILVFEEALFCCCSRLERVSASPMMTKVLLKTRMTLAEICTGKTPAIQLRRDVVT